VALKGPAFNRDLYHPEFCTQHIFLCYPDNWLSGGKLNRPHGHMRCRSKSPFYNVFFGTVVLQLNFIWSTKAAGCRYSGAAEMACIIYYYPHKLTNSLVPERPGSARKGRRRVSGQAALQAIRT
jgi:hypothetical protein